MSDSANTFSSLKSLVKDSYASPSTKRRKDPQAYSKRLERIMDKPNSSKQYFSHIKRYLKKK